MKPFDVTTAGRRCSLLGQDGMRNSFFIANAADEPMQKFASTLLSLIHELMYSSR